jgi:hypothetical protein
LIKYRAGHEPDFWAPDPGVLSHRFALGKVLSATAAAPPLVAVGMNPSHAAETQADKTVNRVIDASVEHGYGGWIMLNLYPERSPKPKLLSKYDPALSRLNCEAIEHVLLRHGVTEVLGAWGNRPHKTLELAEADLWALFAHMGVRVFTWDPLTAKGNPRHPHPPGWPLPMLGPKVYLN